MFPSPLIVGTAALCVAINSLAILLSYFADPQEFLEPDPPLVYHSNILVTANQSLCNSLWVGGRPNLTEPGPMSFTETCVAQTDHKNPDL